MLCPRTVVPQPVLREKHEDTSITMNHLSHGMRRNVLIREIKEDFNNDVPKYTGPV